MPDRVFCRDKSRMNWSFLDVHPFTDHAETIFRFADAQGEH